MIRRSSTARPTHAQLPRAGPSDCDTTSRTTPRIHEIASLLDDWPRAVGPTPAPPTSADAAPSRCPTGRASEIPEPQKKSRSLHPQPSVRSLEVVTRARSRRGDSTNRGPWRYRQADRQEGKTVITGSALGGRALSSIGDLVVGFPSAPLLLILRPDNPLGFQTYLEENDKDEIDVRLARSGPEWIIAPTDRQTGLTFRFTLPIQPDENRERLSGTVADLLSSISIFQGNRALRLQYQLEGQG
ncbi:MAG: hypothetical protein JWQ81_6568 [Amycolatopsis sp.]|nr:hypothetical protein [Amycolatopsis sp.]